MAAKCGYSLVVVVAVVMFSPPVPCCAQLGDLIGVLSSQIGSIQLWKNNQMEFMGSQCFYSQEPKIYRWELWYHGHFSCPGWTKLTGKSKGQNPNKVRIPTIEDFLTQALAQDLVTEEEAREWLEG